MGNGVTRIQTVSHFTAILYKLSLCKYVEIANNCIAMPSACYTCDSSTIINRC